MGRKTIASRLSVVLVVAGMLAGSMSSAITHAQQSEGVSSANTIQTVALRNEINEFLGKELGAHLADIKTLDPPPVRVEGALTTGEFSWGTFMRALDRDAKEKFVAPAKLSLGYSKTVIKSEPNRDCLWLTADEWKALMPEQVKALVDQHPNLNQEQKDKILKNLRPFL